MSARAGFSLEGPTGAGLASSFTHVVVHRIVPHGLLASECPKLLTPTRLSDGLPVATPGEWVTFAVFLWLEARHRSQPRSREGNYMWGPPEGRLPAILRELYKSGYDSASPAPKTVQACSRCSVNVCGLNGCLSTHR